MNCQINTMTNNVFFSEKGSNLFGFLKKELGLTGLFISGGRQFRLLFVIVLLMLNILYGYTLTQDQIKISYPKGYEQLAKFSRNTIHQNIDQIAQIVGATEPKITLFLVNNIDSLINITGNKIPEWAAGVTLTNKNIIVMKTPDFLKSTLRQYKTTLIHEMVHCIQGQVVPLNLTPAWFNEGLAEYISEEYDLHKKVILSRAIIKNRIIPLQEVTDLINFSHVKARLAYAESSSVIEFLIYKFGLEVIHEILNTMKEGTYFAKSLSIHTDIDFCDFPYFWKKYISQRYKWVFMLDIQNILWLIMPIMVIIGFLIKKYRNRKVLKEWEILEQEHEKILD